MSSLLEIDDHQLTHAPTNFLWTTETLSGSSKHHGTRNMEQRCNQLVDCRDESDEDNCKILILKGSYNNKIPPTAASTTNRTVIPVPVRVSIIRPAKGLCSS